MFCKNCGKEIEDNAAVCIHCGVAVKEQSAENGMTMHPVPKCRQCGYVGEFNTGKMFRTKDWLIGLLTLLIGFGLIYLIIIAIIRSDKEHREKICPNCGAKDTATQYY